MRFTAVVARSRMEFLEFAESKADRMRFEIGMDRIRAPGESFILVRRLDQMRGLRPHSIHFTGRWMDLEESQQIRDYACLLVSTFPDTEVEVA